MVKAGGDSAVVAVAEAVAVVAEAVVVEAATPFSITTTAAAANTSYLCPTVPCRPSCLPRATTSQITSCVQGITSFVTGLTV